MSKEQTTLDPNEYYELGAFSTLSKEAQDAAKGIKQVERDLDKEAEAQKPKKRPWEVKFPTIDVLIYGMDTLYPGWDVSKTVTHWDPVNKLAIVKCRIDYSTKDDAGLITYRWFEAVGSADPSNLDGQKKQFPVAIADTRALSRCIRFILNLGVTQEEMNT